MYVNRLKPQANIAFIVGVNMAILWYSLIYGNVIVPVMFYRVCSLSRLTICTTVHTHIPLVAYPMAFPCNCPSTHSPCVSVFLASYLSFQHSTAFSSFCLVTVLAMNPSVHPLLLMHVLSLLSFNWWLPHPTIQPSTNLHKSPTLQWSGHHEEVE